MYVDRLRDDIHCWFREISFWRRRLHGRQYPRWSVLISSPTHWLHCSRLCTWQASTPVSWSPTNTPRAPCTAEFLHMHKHMHKLRNSRAVSNVQFMFSWILSVLTAIFYFPGGPRLAGTRMSPFWILFKLRVMEVVSGNNWSYKTCKAPVKMLPPTNQHPGFLTGQMPFLSPNQQCQSIEGNMFSWIMYLFEYLLSEYKFE